MYVSCMISALTHQGNQGVPNHYNIDTLLTIMMELNLDKVTTLKRMEFSNDSLTMSPHSELLKFLYLQAQHFESMPLE